MRLRAVSLLLLGLVACSEVQPPISLSAILPSPLMPGSKAVAYGSFPENTRLFLEGALLVAKPVANGLEFALPESSLAGQRTLRLETRQEDLETVLQVIPRIDRAYLLGKRLKVEGAGWPKDRLSTVQLSVDISGTELIPELSSGDLLLDVPEALPYGNLSIRLKVEDQFSETFSLLREAASVEGRAILPASESLSYSRQSLPKAVTALPAFMVHGEGAFSALDKAGFKADKEALAVLGIERFSFSDKAQAQAAYGLLEKAGYRLEWDVPVSSDGFAAVQMGQKRESSWHLPLLGLEPAWQQNQGEGIIVAVIDTGVKLDHPDLQAKLLPGYDFVDKDTEAEDLAGHGTHVAGLIAGEGLGTAPQASLLPVRVLEGTSGGSVFAVTQGILWAAGLLNEPANANPAQVINLSLGSASYSASLAKAIERVLAAGVAVVAATGNAGGPLAYPAALPGVIAVTALAGPSLAYQPWYANRGKGVWLTAYGGDTSQDQDQNGVLDGIVSSDLNGYSLRMGTSMAAPQVAGLAALALAAGSPNYLLRDSLAGTATELGVYGYDQSFGYGLVNGRAVSLSKPRLYVLAFDAKNTLLAWTLLQEDLSYSLHNLPPEQELSLWLASDEDQDGVLAEAGEMHSESLAIYVDAGLTQEVNPLQLSIADGSNAYNLETGD